jgi:hypothetical protein
MTIDYEVFQLANVKQLLQALRVTDLAGSDVPDCSRGVMLVRFSKQTPVTAQDVGRALSEWKGDIPLVLVADASFETDALSAVSEYEDAHVFQPSA